jgi:D-3-phosphoglycerate dehydrogenase
MFLSQVLPGAMERVEVGLYGDLREIDVKPILAAAVTGVLKPSLAGGVTLVNALTLAKEKGIEVVESTSTARLAFANLMALRLRTSDGELSVAGTLFGASHLRLVDVDGVEVDAIPQGNLLLVKNDDTPGVVGHIGTLLGARQVNIARMTVGRKAGSGRAVMLIEVDNEVPPEVVAEVSGMAGIREARSVRLG